MTHSCLFWFFSMTTLVLSFPHHCTNVVPSKKHCVLQTVTHQWVRRWVRMIRSWSGNLFCTIHCLARSLIMLLSKHPAPGFKKDRSPSTKISSRKYQKLDTNSTVGLTSPPTKIHISLSDSRTTTPQPPPCPTPPPCKGRRDSPRSLSEGQPPGDGFRAQNSQGHPSKWNHFSESLF